MISDFYTFKNLKKYNTIMHAVTKKVDKENYLFSLALHTGEKESEIIENRFKLSKILTKDKKLNFIVAKQTHSDHIEVLKSNQSKGWNSLDSAIENCDALITNLKDVALTVLTADCVPILLYDRKKEVIAVVHAGWRGTKEQILAKTIEKMFKEFGSLAKDIVAGIAPSIGACCYEVGDDVAKHFSNIQRAYIQKNDKYMLDLPTINKKQLLSSGVKEENIEMSNICTACNVTSFFSYRKEAGCSGRFMSIIAMI